MSETVSTFKEKLKKSNGWIISAIVVCTFILMLCVTIKSCSKDGTKKFNIERIIDKGNGIYTVVVEDDIQYTFSIDDVKIGEKNEVCIDTAGVDEIKYVSITSKMAKSLDLDIKEQDGVIIVRDLPETSEETAVNELNDNTSKREKENT